MNEINYLIFLYNNRLNENYSFKELKRELKNRIAELLRGQQGKKCQECENIIGTSNGCILCKIFNDAYSEEEE